MTLFFSHIMIEDITRERDGSSRDYVIHEDTAQIPSFSPPRLDEVECGLAAALTSVQMQAMADTDFYTAIPTYDDTEVSGQLR